MNLIIDVGNSRIKLAVFNHLEMVYNEVVTNKKLIERLKEIIKEFKPNKAYICVRTTLN